MKLLKKVLAGALSLAVVAGAMFAFTGCNSVKNKTYAVESYTVTIVKAVDEEGKVTETQTLTMREAYIYEKCQHDLEQISTYVLTAEDEKEYNEMLEDMLKYEPKLVFGKDTVEYVMDMKNELTGKIARRVQVYEYEVDGDVITLTSKLLVDDAEKTCENEFKYEISTVEIVDGKLYQKGYMSEESDYVWTVGEMYYTTTIFAEVK